MIQIIGIMVGLYILVRMVQIASTQSESKATKNFAVINFILTILLMLFLLASGSTSFPR